MNASWNGELSRSKFQSLTLTSDLVSRFGITSIFVEVGIPNLVSSCDLGMVECCEPFTGHCDLEFEILPRF